MASTLYGYLSNQNAQPQRTPVNGPMGMMQQYNEFAKTVKDPKAEVEKLLANGQMSKEQFNMLGKMANNFIGQRR